MSEKRYFTLEEANTALASIRPMVGRILEIRGSVIEKQPQVWPVLERAAGNGGNIQASQMAFEFNELDGLVHQVQATGAELKDINNGIPVLEVRRGRYPVLARAGSRLCRASGTVKVDLRTILGDTDEKRGITP
jgi:hypothetical protein